MSLCQIGQVTKPAATICSSPGLSQPVQRPPSFRLCRNWSQCPPTFFPQPFFARCVLSCQKAGSIRSKRHERATTLTPGFRPAGTSHRQTSLTSSRADCSLEPTSTSGGPRSSSPPAPGPSALCLSVLPSTSPKHPIQHLTYPLTDRLIYPSTSASRNIRAVIHYFFLQTTRRRCEQPCT